MATEQERNKEVVVRMFEETWNRGHMEVVEEVLAPDFRDYPPKRFFATPLQGRASLTDVVVAFREGMPDFHFEMVQLAAEGDLVFCLGRATGTHTGTFFGIGPTGHKVDVFGINEFRLRNGVITERWGMFNVMGMMQQIGLIPSEGATTDA